MLYIYIYIYSFPNINHANSNSHSKSQSNTKTKTKTKTKSQSQSQSNQQIQYGHFIEITLKNTDICAFTWVIDRNGLKYVQLLMKYYQKKQNKRKHYNFLRLYLNILQIMTNIWVEDSFDEMCKAYKYIFKNDYAQNKLAEYHWNWIKTEILYKKCYNYQNRNRQTENYYTI